MPQPDQFIAAALDCIWKSRSHYKLEFAALSTRSNIRTATTRAILSKRRLFQQQTPAYQKHLQTIPVCTHVMVDQDEPSAASSTIYIYIYSETRIRSLFLWEPGTGATILDLEKQHLGISAEQHQEPLKQRQPAMLSCSWKTSKWGR